MEEERKKRNYSEAYPSLCPQSGPFTRGRGFTLKLVRSAIPQPSPTPAQNLHFNKRHRGRVYPLQFEKLCPEVQMREPRSRKFQSVILHLSLESSGSLKKIYTHDWAPT